MFKFKHKFINIFVVLILILSSVLAAFTIKNVTVFASAAQEPHQSDRDKIENIIFEMAKQDNLYLDEFSYSIEDVHISDVKWGGYLIEFCAKECIGYSIIFKINDTLKLIEINFENHSPYFKKDGIRMYPSLGYYILKIDNHYYDATTMEITEDYTETDLPTFYAACSSDKTNVPVTREISYSEGSRVSYELRRFQDKYYCQLNSDSNNCANTAGLILVNYWNKKFKNDLLKLSDNDLNDEGDIVNRKGGEIMSVLYDYMKTNWFLGVGGTLPSDCYDGFTKYINSYGYKTEKETDLNYQRMVSNISDGIPVIIVSQDYYFSSGNTDRNLPPIEPGPGNYKFTVEYSHSYGVKNAHTFIGYGYASYFFYNSKGEGILEQFIKIATGWGSSCYYNLSLSKSFSSAAIKVYKG